MGDISLSFRLFAICSSTAKKVCLFVVVVDFFFFCEHGVR